MRNYHYNLMYSCVLLIWGLAFTILLSLGAGSVLADPVNGCSCGCSCSANLSCDGCQIANPNPPPGPPAQLGAFILVPLGRQSIYTACNPDGSNFSCASQTISCFTVSDGQKVAVYNKTCTQQTGTGQGLLYVYATGCTSSGACGGT